jgi:hypothetical protein
MDVFYLLARSGQFAHLVSPNCLSMVDFRKPLFDPGSCVATPAALDAIENAGMDATEILDRHVTGDWGDLCEDDCHANDTALVCGSRILSYYRLSTGQEIYIITDAKGDDGKRQTTTIMLRGEY